MLWLPSCAPSLPTCGRKRIIGVKWLKGYLCLSLRRRFGSGLDQEADRDHFRGTGVACPGRHPHKLRGFTVAGHQTVGKMTIVRTVDRERGRIAERFHDGQKRRQPTFYGQSIWKRVKFPPYDQLGLRGGRCVRRLSRGTGCLPCSGGHYAVPDQCLHLGEADVWPPRRKSGFNPLQTSMPGHDEQSGNVNLRGSAWRH